MNALELWIEGEHVGLLEVDAGIWQLHYADSWCSAGESFPLSPNLPLQLEPLIDADDRRTVRWFFDNLLPEGAIREALAAHARLSEADSFGLLSRYGRESAGAITLVPPGDLVDGGSYHALASSELRRLIADLPRVPFIAAGGRARMSLAGAQHKLALHRLDETWLIPQGDAASSLIVKPDNARAELFPFCPANEHFCVSLARRVGLVAPLCELVHLPEPLFVIHRYDRESGPSGVRRLHQIDLCQLLDLSPGAKYEGDGGPGIEEVYRALEATRQPAASRLQWLRLLIFNYAIGNSDAHAKNIAFLVDRAGVHLAPAYDLLSVAVYGAEFDYMAMLLEGEVRYGWVEPDHWQQLAVHLGIPNVYLRRLRHSLARAIDAAASELLAGPMYTAQERRFLSDVVALIQRHVSYLLRDE